ncbi:hypothetical protein SASPL_151248 [Salvia splendens]|uniref:Uncharacterized protein n=1 Tax=Salvia splendens TaxID=180675 RepID=A0A8X8Z3F1_SALSN|nr:hypothetical protein SASPL_151248 [Salvia splendens]
MGSRKGSFGVNYDYSFKVLLIGDYAVGKSFLLLSFISNCQQFPHELSPTIGTDCFEVSSKWLKVVEAGCVSFYKTANHCWKKAKTYNLGYRNDDFEEFGLELVQSEEEDRQG